MDDMPGSGYRSYHFEHYSYEKYGRFWAVYDGAGQLVCVAVYRKGAKEVIRRLSPLTVAEGDHSLPSNTEGRPAATTEELVAL